MESLWKFHGVLDRIHLAGVLLLADTARTSYRGKKKSMVDLFLLVSHRDVGRCFDCLYHADGRTVSLSLDDSDPTQMRNFTGT